MKLFCALVLIALLPVIASCGKKGPVRPLQANLPDAVIAAELVQRGDELLLSWQLPIRNQNGSPLETAPVVDIYRMPYDPADYCPECKDRATLLFSINPELPAPAQLSANRYTLHDRQVTVGQGYRYRLVPKNELNREGRSLSVRIVVVTPPAEPQGLQVKGLDQGAALTWSPLTPPAGMELLGYRIYRRDAGVASPAELLNQRLLTVTEYTDINLGNNTEYRYQVSAVLKQGERILESLASAAVGVIPQKGL
ncbi:MAG: fibronectin type III domain-containing protein [Desulfuromonadales bacterium]|nr:fibronectin type III domain-containing protein [Desulfuromonadales bacterium]